MRKFVNAEIILRVLSSPRFVKSVSEFDVRCSDCEMT